MIHRQLPPPKPLLLPHIYKTLLFMIGTVSRDPVLSYAGGSLLCVLFAVLAKDFYDFLPRMVRTGLQQRSSTSVIVAAGILRLPPQTLQESSTEL